MGGKVIKGSYPLKVLKVTYDHSCSIEHVQINIST
jgi:hypothetical protein